MTLEKVLEYYGYSSDGFGQDDEALNEDELYNRIRMKNAADKVKIEAGLSNLNAKRTENLGRILARQEIEAKVKASPVFEKQFVQVQLTKRLDTLKKTTWDEDYQKNLDGQIKEAFQLKKEIEKEVDTKTYKKVALNKIGTVIDNFAVKDIRRNAYYSKSPEQLKKLGWDKLRKDVESKQYIPIEEQEKHLSDLGILKLTPTQQKILYVKEDKQTIKEDILRYQRQWR